ncbi:DUF2169 domain-containing protein [Fulvimarina sp. MAC8]|uniref:DUF2169 family type VI secretion system accessory protein n=1 Tax=Fulvimarina sp. MAC8 TaxID=3162874 RepID=UPI0032EB532C
MKLVNPTPLVANAFRQFDQAGDLDCVVAVKATFEHRQGDGLKLHEEQEPFQWEDAYEGDPHTTMQIRQTDLTPGKVGTDVTFLGFSYAPGDTDASTWPASLTIGSIDKTLAIHGERWWSPKIREKWAGFLAKGAKRIITDWTLTEPKATRQVPLSWDKAFGGPFPQDEEAEQQSAVEPRNPLGCGIVNCEMSPDIGAVAAPQIDWPDSKLDWRERPEPAGFGPVSPWWRSRQRHAGTYDQAWLDERHPLLPEDFDTRFWQSAPPDQVAIPFLQGDETYKLANLSASYPVAEGRLPDIRLAVRVEGSDADGWRLLVLDGVHFDWRKDHRIILTWRGRFPLPEATGVTLTLARALTEPPRGSEHESDEASHVDA